MKKTGLLIVGVTVLLALGGCSENKEQATIQKQEKQIETLTHEKKELELLLENEKQKAPVSSSPTVETTVEESDTEELTSLFDSFIRAQFEQDDEALKPLTTAKLYTILVDKAGERETSVSFKSTVKSITLYQAESLNDTEAVLVGKIEVETKVGDFAPSRYQQLVECTAMKDSEGVFQVDTQTLTNLAQ